MKKVFWLMTILLAGVSLTSSRPTDGPAKSPRPANANVALKEAPGGIQFTDAAWKDILKKAKAEKKIIFLDAYAEWCGPCKMLQKQVFTKKNVGDLYNIKFINVKMDMEKGEGLVLSEIYPLEFYPTLFFIDGNGRVLKKIHGFQSPEKMIEIGRNVKG